MNIIRTGVLLAALTAMFLAIGYLLGGRTGLFIALAVSVATNLFAYWNGDKMVLSMYGAQPATAEESPDLYAMVDELADRAGLQLRKYI